ncbi:MAG: M1 family peptidase [Sphingobacteriales bacterium]|nr:MAG: M1 family peptidase [Sphingobacteriales bacterium]
MKRYLLISYSLFLISYCSTAQPLNHKKTFTRQDTLRGSLGPERTWWDVTHYTIDVKPDINNKTITGKNGIDFKVLKPGKKMQIDLQEPMQIDKITYKDQQLNFSREGNVYWVDFAAALKINTNQSITIFFSGKPREAVNPPWDGGWIWKKDCNGNPWVSVACQGLGASVWYPCKDHQSDEPDFGAVLNITVPDSLTAIGNGTLSTKQDNHDGTVTYMWNVSQPINNYNIVPYIGKYVNWSEEYQGLKGKLSINYWFLKCDEAKAKAHIPGGTDSMMKALEYWFGPYPFYEDGYKLVQSPHLGMEHQSAIAYGNKFMYGYLGRDLSGSGWGLKWDYIIVHESGHEWFANNITTKDIADMWVHEGITDYSETLYTEYYFGKSAGEAYVQGQRDGIQNKKNIIGIYGVNQEGSGDMYPKGANLMHTVRSIIDNDSLFRNILHGLNEHFYHKTVTSKEVEEYIAVRSGTGLSKVFDQYLRDIRIPVLEYYTTTEKGYVILNYRWTNCVEGFNMPVKLPADKNGKKGYFIAGEKWQQFKTNFKTAEELTADLFDKNFYVEYKKVK